MAKRPYPDIDPIPDTPENIARMIMKEPPKEEWEFKKVPEEPATDESGG